MEKSKWTDYWLNNICDTNRLIHFSIQCSFSFNTCSVIWDWQQISQCNFPLYQTRTKPWLCTVTPLINIYIYIYVCIYVTVYVTYEYNLIFIFISYFGGTLKDFVLFYLDFYCFISFLIIKMWIFVYTFSVCVARRGIVQSCTL